MPKTEDCQQDPRDVGVARANMVGKGFFLLKDGGAEDLGLRVERLVAGAAARALDQVISSGVFAIPGQLAFGEPHDRELVDVLCALGYTHESTSF